MRARTHKRLEKRQRDFLGSTGSGTSATKCTAAKKYSVRFENLKADDDSTRADQGLEDVNELTDLTLKRSTALALPAQQRVRTGAISTRSLPDFLFSSSFFSLATGTRGCSLNTLASVGKAHWNFS